MNKIQDLRQRLIAYKVLPEPHYQAVGEHLLDVVSDIDEEIKKLKEAHVKEVAKAFITGVDKIACEGTMQIKEGQYLYTITATKIHESVAKNHT